MNGDFIRYRGLVAVAVGAGVMIGAASVFLYQQLFGERRRLLLQEDISQLGETVAEIRRELDTLRVLQIQRKSRNSKRLLGAASITTEAETEMFSVVGGDEVDDEFFDFSSDNENMAEENKDSTFDEIDTLLEGSSREDKTKGYGLLLELLDKDLENPEILWRMTKACHMMGSLNGAEGDKDKMKEFVYKGVDYGQKAIEIDAENWKAHKWFAICVGARGQLQSVKEKLRDGHVFKEHVDKAIKINPQDATLHHLCGRFNYEVAGLSWLEKKVANTLFGEVPPGTYKQAIDSLLEAEKLNSTAWKENRLLLAKCYVGEKNYQEALEWLDKAKEIPAASAEEKNADKEIDSLLKKYNSYRGLMT
ncbi:regulator of microtubule dynamics protein 1-like [Macrosteles quadrilineatus]|uniref:regulator of microtubule dynamics protein 1-like n=1 Tax=Macrosteles quadrilineatus TaxID=74068 RepID=UPI0023E291A4|nr:regulator of microtubule dynamics protein 1-like [Macrosteles quadrilineatus]XP_054280784.1 regulator of microtubule dynamics protein 1-like [Macrosteles quadrilineatus]XP_054280813.1 regulator of microtubule dynamics protein 1-like [Macrosteles quadrilineatus]